MPYPIAPWTLCGYAVQTLHLVDTEVARSFIPPEFTIVPVFPGKTLGGVYLSYYGSGSVLQYSELIVVAALLNHSGKVGPWISHIYVDNEDSVAGGQEIWGLPKELAEFTWDPKGRSQVAVRQATRTLCTLTWGQPFSLWKQSLAATSFSQLDSTLLSFGAEATLRPGLVQAALDVPTDSPLATLKLHQPWLTISAEDLRLQVNPPEVIGQKYPVQS